VYARRGSQESDSSGMGMAGAVVIDVAQVHRMGGTYPIRYPRRPGSYGTLQLAFALFFLFMTLTTLKSAGGLVPLFWFLMTIVQVITYYKMAPKEYRIYGDRVTVVPWYSPEKEIVIPFHDIELVMFNSGICHGGVFYTSNTGMYNVCICVIF
jgi:hypothetical protein